MKLIILGNGFDLHHQYQTSFSHFRTHLQNSKNASDKNLVTKIDKIIGVDTENPKTHLLWNDYESIIGELMESSKYLKHSVKNIPNLLAEFTQSFYNYLVDINAIENHNTNKKILEEFNDAAIILTFNYTSIYSSYIKNGQTEIFHIHGDLSKENLPVIGFYYPNALKSSIETDYLKKYGNKEVHKSALSFKQNEIDLDQRINAFKQKWKNKITEIVIVGYSFGKSDQHIYGILNDILVETTAAINVPSTKAKGLKSIIFKVYKYNEEEAYNIIEKIKSSLTNFHRRLSINITGVGYTPKEKEIITFELKNY